MILLNTHSNALLKLAFTPAHQSLLYHYKKKKITLPSHQYLSP